MTFINNLIFSGILFCLFACCPAKHTTLQSNQSVWQDLSPKSISNKSVDLPRKYRLLKLDVPTFIQTISSDSISLPIPEGGFIHFTITKSSVMSPALAAKFPDIKTYKGTGINEKASLRFERRKNQFYFSVITESQNFLINPITQSDSLRYISYNKNDVDSTFRLPFELPHLNQSK